MRGAYQTHASSETAQSTQAESNADNHGQLLDTVIAVVNNQVILQSDLDFEMHIFHLLPSGDAADYTPGKALQRLITRALIEQQIVQEDPHGLEITPKALDASLDELRHSSPDCQDENCATAAGWASYLAKLELNPEAVRAYWADRMAILRFIEVRFRSGIRITPEAIRKYYQEVLLPRYSTSTAAPPLERVAPRIEEILLQQQVNTLLDEWLKSLQSQGQVEVLDPSLRAQEIRLPGPASPNDSRKGNGGSF